MNNLAEIIVSSLKEILILAPIVLISITIHEWSHAFASYKLGDYTAKSEGRLSLNPLKHIDPIGAIFFIFFRFGWAKPVPVKTLYFAHPKRDMAITAIAGPTSNFLLAIATIPFLAASLAFHAPQFITTFFTYLMSMNISFGIFNLIPIPPLDGSRLLTYFLPNDLYMKFLYYEKYAFIVFILLMFTGIFGGIMSVCTNFVFNLLAVPTEGLATILFNMFMR